MKYGYRFFLFLCVLSCLCLIVGAVDASPEDSVPSDLETTIPKIALDDETLQALIDALVPTESDGDAPSADSEPTIPSVELDPKSVDSIAEAMGEDRSCDSAEICNQSRQTNHLIILNIYIQSASANASEYQRYEKDDQVPKEQKSQTKRQMLYKGSKWK